MYTACLIFCLGYFIQCGKNSSDNKEIIGYFHLSDEELNICPYTGTESLIFKDSTGDTIVYNNGHRSISKEMNCDHSPSPDLPTSECYYFDHTYIQYFDEGILIDLYPEYNFTSKQLIKRFKLLVSVNPNIGALYGICDFDSGKFIPSNNYGGLNVDFFDSINISMRKYDSVYRFTGGYGHCCVAKADTVDCVYYTIKEGIVGFQTQKGKFYYLK
jgi:hypothetical protein